MRQPQSSSKTSPENWTTLNLPKCSDSVDSSNQLITLKTITTVVKVSASSNSSTLLRPREQLKTYIIRKSETASHSSSSSDEQIDLSNIILSIRPFIINPQYSSLLPHQLHLIIFLNIPQFTPIHPHLYLSQLSSPPPSHLSLTPLHLPQLNSLPSPSA